MTDASCYALIEDYAIIGDCHCAALVSKGGSLDWLCLPRFDSPSIFGALLDAKKGGRFLVCPARDFTVERRYVGESNVLETTFKTDTGLLRLTDLMPVYSLEDTRQELWPHRQVLRVLECVEGQVEVEVTYEPRFGYAGITPRLMDRGALGIYGEHRQQALFLRSDLRLALSPDQTCAYGGGTLRQGERRYLALAFAQGEPGIIPLLGHAADSRAAETIQWWEKWASRCSYNGPYRDAVVRSALTLKLLTAASSGAVIAAPTTSLPEKIGGDRNWDYRYCWLRDASMTLRAFCNLGYAAEGETFLSWLLHSTRLTWPKLQVLYDTYGETHLRERELRHLEGYAASGPVRIGNAAKDQAQLDVYGEVIDAAYEFVKRFGGRLDRSTARMLRGLGDTVCRQWREPDEGIWEIRNGRRQHTYSKVLCWAALDRLLKLHEAGHVTVPARWFAEERDAIRAETETRGYNEDLGSYVSMYDSEAVDVSLLLLPAYGYAEAASPRMRRTYSRIVERLRRNGLFCRYSSEYDGLPPGEGAFASASFWAIECRARCGQVEAAKQDFEYLLSFGNDVGLFAEEIDVETGAALGNFPQAYTHVGLINAALTLAESAGHRQG